MTARDDTETDESTTTDTLPTTGNPTIPDDPTDRPVPMQPRHGPRPRRLN